MYFKNINIRKIGTSDQDFLYEMLFQAIFTPKNEPAPSKDIIYKQDLKKYVENWGRQGDLGLIAIDHQNKSKVGAIWIRLFNSNNPSYGYINSNIPELGMAVMYNYRGLGIGSTLLEKLIQESKGLYPAISLSVHPENPAIKLYENFGFHPFERSGSSVIMKIDIA